MSYLIINDGNTYKIAQVIETFKNHQQVELVSEKIKKKIKLEQTIYQLSTEDINQFSQTLNQLILDIDINLLSDTLADSSRTSIKQLAELYFGNNYNEIELTALLLALASETIQFIDYKDGSFTKCTLEEQSRRQKIADEQLKQQQLFEQYYDKLMQLKNPNFSQDTNIIKLINKANKHSAEYRALTQASKNLQLSPVELLYNVGVITDLPQFFLDTFLMDNFPNGINYNLIPATDVDYPIADNLALDVFSIDDKTTTEIDDAFSVTNNGNGAYTIGVHIASPAIDNSVEDIIADNISTIYYPGGKITMLPSHIIDKYSLIEDNVLPVVSIYFVTDNDFNIVEYYSKLERLKITKNLRIEDLEHLFQQPETTDNFNHPYAAKLKILYKFANQLEKVRGKPSVNSIACDYNFSFAANKIIILPRIRGNPIDKLVSELMIQANCTWGRMLTNAFIPAIYRVKKQGYPVKMTLNADAHSGLNVSYYTWATSPLRRSADYINQRQIISLITNSKNYYSGTNHVLLQVADSFDKTYAKYIDFQNKLERYWSLKYLIQENINQVTATFIHKSKVQLAHVPIQINTEGLINPKPKGSTVTVKISDINLTSLTFNFKIIEENISN